MIEKNDDYCFTPLGPTRKLSRLFHVCHPKLHPLSLAVSQEELVKEPVSLKWKMYGWPYFSILFGLYIFYMTDFMYYIYCQVKFCDGNCTNSGGNIIFQQKLLQVILLRKPRKEKHGVTVLQILQILSTHGPKMTGC